MGYKSLPRGTYITAEQIQQNLSSMSSGLDTGGQNTSVDRAPWSISLSGTIDGTTFNSTESLGWVQAFVIPYAWGNPSIQKLKAPIARIQKVLISWDDTMEALARTGSSASVRPGILQATDMERLTLTLTVQQQPLNAGPLAVQPQGTSTEVFSLTISGAQAFGTQYRFNPWAYNCEFDVFPNCAYVVSVKIPGLYNGGGTTQENLCFPSMHISFTGDTPIVDWKQDSLADDIMNCPQQLITKTPTPVVFSNPSVGSVISADGSSGIQTNLNTLEDRLLIDDRMYQTAQNGVSSGLTADGVPEPVQSLQKSGWQQTTIAIPIFEGFPVVRASNAGAQLPFCLSPGPYIYTGSRATITIPQNMIIDHVFVWVSNNSPPQPTLSPLWYDWGTQSFGPNYHIKVGVAMSAHGPTQTEQQIAYVDINPVNSASQTVHRVTEGARSVGTIYELPLSGPDMVQSWSDDGTSYPIYVGRTTKEASDTRTPISPGYGSPLQTPITMGRETHLWARVILEDTVDYLDDAARPDDVRIGVGGFVVYVCGRQPLVGYSGSSANGRLQGLGESGIITGDRGV